MASTGAVGGGYRGATRRVAGRRKGREKAAHPYFTDARICAIVSAIRERYPDCDFVSWDLPVSERCPVCGSPMVFKRGAKGARFHVCTNETCRHRVELEGEADE